MKMDDAVETIKNILERPGVNSIHLYLKPPGGNMENFVLQENTRTAHVV